MNLAGVVLTVHQMELAPLGGSERAEDGMVHDRLAAEAALALLNQVVHAGDIPQNFSSHFFRRHAAGQGAFGRLAARGKVSDVDNEEAPPPGAGAVGAGVGGAGLQAALEAFDGAGVAEIKVLEDLGGAPFRFGMAGELAGSEAAESFGENVVQLIQMGMHGWFSRMMQGYSRRKISDGEAAMKRNAGGVVSKALLAMAVMAMALGAGCTSDSQPAATKPQPPDLLTGRAAFQQLFIAARGWAQDIKPYQLQSQPYGDYRGKDGKAVAWRASFASATRGSKPFTWSGMDSPDGSAPRGITPGTADNYAPSGAFDIAFLKIDSDKAFEVGQKHGGDKVLADAPDTPVSYLLDWSVSENNLVWHVIYGNSRNDAKLVVDLDASTGDFIRKEK